MLEDEIRRSKEKNRKTKLEAIEKSKTKYENEIGSKESNLRYL